MKRVQIDMDKLASYPCSGNRMLQVGPGTITGYLSISTYLHPRNPRSDLADVHIQFDFIDQGGFSRRYTAISSPFIFWPDPGVVVKPSEPLPLWDHAFETIDDSREDFELHFEDGHTVHGRGKYAPMMCQICIHKSHLEVFTRILCIDAGTPDDFAEVAYELSISKVLWRNAPIEKEYSIDTWSTDYVQIDDIPPLSNELPRSPIRVQKSDRPVIPKRDQPVVGPRKRWPINVSASSNSKLVLPCSDGLLLAVYPGTINGLLTLDDILIGMGGVTEFTRIIFDFVSQDNKCWRYESVVSGAGFLPSPGVTVRLGDSPKVWDHLVMYTSESVGMYELIFDNGYIAKSSQKRRSFTYSINVEGEGLRVHACLGSDDPRAKLGCLEIEYELPIGALLWRKAPLGELPNLQAEADEYIKVIELEKPLKGIKPSPILIQ